MKIGLEDRRATLIVASSLIIGSIISIFVIASTVPLATEPKPFPAWVFGDNNSR